MQVRRLSYPQTAIALCAIVLALGTASPPGRAQSKSDDFERSTSLDTLPNGTYLWGDSPSPDTVAGEYGIFQVTEAIVTGGFYVNHTDHSYCFTGTAGDGEIVNAQQGTWEYGSSDWQVSASDPIDLSNLTFSMHADLAPEWGQGLLEDCLDLFQP